MVEFCGDIKNKRAETLPRTNKLRSILARLTYQNSSLCFESFAQVKLAKKQVS